MTRARQIQELATLTQMVFEAKSAEVRTLAKRQQDLLDRLAALRSEEEAAQISFQEDLQLRMSGADIAWQSWLGRQKAAINAEMARVRAEKERELAKLRHSFGRKEVAARLAKKL